MSIKEKRTNKVPGKALCAYYLSPWVKQRLKPFKNKSAAVEEALIAYYKFKRPGKQKAGE